MEAEYQDRVVYFVFKSELDIRLVHLALSWQLASPTDKIIHEEVLKVDRNNRSSSELRGDYIYHNFAFSTKRLPYFVLDMGDPRFIQYNQEKLKFYHLKLYLVDYIPAQENEPTQYRRAISDMGNKIELALMQLEKKKKLIGVTPCASRYLSKSERLALKI